MPRRNGSYFGFTAAPTPTAASGIWRVSEAEQYLRENKWPATPGVPGSPAGTPGDGQVSLTWSAPTLGSPPTDYEVQYSSNAGSTWTTFTDGVGTTTSATVTGLTNGTGYIFRVRALNALGEGPYGSASGTITPQAINVTLLMHFDGSDGSTTFTDSSPSNLTFTRIGDPIISTGESKFGGASGYFATEGDYLSIPATSALQVGEDNFTLEAWVRVSSTSGYCVIWGKRDWSAESNLEVNLYLINSSDYLVMSDNGGYWTISSPGTATIASNTWTHIALVRNGTQVRTYVDGVVSQEHTFAGGVYLGEGELRIGLSDMEVYIDELRIVQGTAVYTDPFTPPTAPF